MKDKPKLSKEQILAHLVKATAQQRLKPAPRPPASLRDPVYDHVEKKDERPTERDVARP